MKKVYKVTLVLLAALVVTLAFVSTASAVKYGKLTKNGSIAAYASDGSLTPLTYRWRGGGVGNPLDVVVTLPNGYVSGTPTKVVAKYTYVDAKLHFANGRKTTFRKWFARHKLGGAKARLSAQWMPLPDAPKLSQSKRLKAFKMGRSGTLTFWVNFPCVQPVDFTMILYPKVPKTWVCWPPDLFIEFEAFVRKSKPRSFAPVSHKLRQMGIFVYPAAPSPEPVPAQPQPADPAPPTEPTGPTGPSGPSGPTP